jgi:PAS domain S-box-containing protein
LKSGLSLQKQINAVLFGLALVFFLVVGGVSTLVQYKGSMAEYGDLMEKKSQLISRLIANHITIEGQRLTTIAKEVAGHGSPQILDILAAKLYPTLQSSVAYVLDKEGRVILINPAQTQFIGFNLSHMAWRHRQQGFSTSYQSVFTNASVIAEIYPLPDGMSLVLERDVLSILSELDIFREEFGVHGISLFIMDQQGLAIYHPDPDVVRSRHNLGFEMKDGGKKTQGLEHILYENQLYYGSQQELDSPSGWRLLLLASANFVRAELTRVLLQQLFVLFIFCGLIALTLGFYLNRFFSRPVRGMVRSITQYKDDPSGPVIQDSSTIAEFQEIARAINEMAQTVQVSRQQFATILDSMDALVYVADMETYELLFVNAYGRKVWGDIDGKRCWQVLQGDQDGPCPFCTNDRLVDESGRPTGVYGWEMQNTRTRTWFACRDQAITWVDGRQVRLEIATDITSQKTTSQELQKSKEWLHSILQTAPMGIGMAVDRVFTMVNREVVDLTGYDEQELLGQKFSMLYPSDGESERVGRVTDEQIHEFGTGSLETQFRRKDGVLRDVLLVSTPLDEQDLTKGVLFTVLDITERKQTENLLQEQYRLTEKRVQARTQELAQKNKELEDLNRYYVDREFRIKELKMIIDRLKKGEGITGVQMAGVEKQGDLQ